MKTILRRLTKTLAGAATLVSLSMAAAQATDVDQAARALLPQDIIDKGHLVIGGTMAWPPYQWMSEDGQPTGIEPDMMSLLAAKLGLEAQIQDVKFATVIPSLATGRLDIGTGQMGILRSRLETVDFVPWSMSRLSLITAKGKSALDINDLCGATVAVTMGSVQVGVLDRLNAACLDAQKADIIRAEYPDTPSSYMAVASARADAFILTQAVGRHMVGQNPAFEASTSTLEGSDTLTGFMIGKDRSALQAALSQALASAMADGSYQEILAKYGVENVAIAPDVLTSDWRATAVE